MASVTRQPPAREEGGMVALSQMPTFLAVEQKNFYGELVTPSEVSGENVGVLVTTREEKTAPPKKPRLQKGHCKYFKKHLPLEFKCFIMCHLHLSSRGSCEVGQCIEDGECRPCKSIM